MKNSIITKLIVLLSFIFLYLGCTEPFALKSKDFEDVIVIEATITDELNKQVIKISKASKLDDAKYIFEAGCEVTVKTATETFVFDEVNEKYVSRIAFQAIADNPYTLFVKTKNGRIYSSDSQELTNSTSEIQSVEAQLEVKNEVSGIQLVVSSEDLNNSSTYYRYEFEETAKVITPFWSPAKARLGQGPKGQEPIIVIGRTPEELDSKICYRTNLSKGVFVTSTSGLSIDKVDKLPLEFIPFDDYRIANRYSFLVRQYVLNSEAYTFYKTLSKFSGSSSILSANQPGFINGNIASATNEDSKAIGFFNVSSVKTKRIFLNYNDVFPNETSSSYYCKCKVDKYDSTYYDDLSIGEPRSGYAAIVLRDYFRENTASYFFRDGVVYSVVRNECGNCTLFASVQKPEFWID